MQAILSFLNNNEGAIMVIMTGVYVFATIRICRFNAKSVKATRDQVAESKRQFEESKRLEVMPVLTIESEQGIVNRSVPSNIGPDIKKTLSSIYVKNIGLGTAHTLKCYKNFNQGNEKWEDLVRYLQVGETTPIRIQTYYGDQSENKDEVFTFDFSFFDLLNNEYSQKIDLVSKCDGGSFIISDCKVHDVTLIQKGESSDV